MKLGLINSAWLGTSVDTARGIQLTKEIGFDTIDIFADPLEITPQEKRTIRDTCALAELPIISVVCCALGIADFNTPVRRFHLHRAKSYLDFGYDLRAKNLLLVLGEYIWNQEVIAPSDQWKWAVEGVVELGSHAEQLGLEIAVEIEPFALSIVNNVGRVDQFLRDVAYPNVKANIDVSHLALAKDGAGEISRLAGRIAHAHLSDCDGRKHGDLPPGRGVVDFPPYLKALAESGFDGTVSIELEYSPEPGKIVDWVREAYQSSSSLMASLGIRTNHE
jgi:D-psicose/D-tagatose/L-ribulose 3-epimerase